MALREEFERSGNWLFRWRSYLPLFLIGILLLSLNKYQYPFHSEKLDYIWEIICLTVSFFGLLIRVITVGHTPKGTSGRNTKQQVAEVLNTTGAYSIVRNPLYLGNFFYGPWSHVISSPMVAYKYLLLNFLALLRAHYIC